jgi:hypothetical protein
MFRRRHIGCLVLFAFVLAAPLRAQSVSFDKSFYTFQEAAGTGSVTVARTGDPATSLSVPYHSVIDTSIVDGTFTFAPNEMTKVFSITVPNDGVYDQGSHLFTTDYYIELRPTGDLYRGANWHVPIHVVDASPPPALTVNSVAVAEGNSGVTLAHTTVTFSAPFKRVGHVTYYPVEPFVGSFVGSAIADSDYPLGLFGALLPAGQTSVDLPIRVYGDQTPEPDEYFVISVFVDDLPDAETISVTILNDDYILTPGSQRIGRGTVGSANVTSPVPTPTTDHVLLSSSDPGVLTVPAFVDVPAGSLSKAFDVTAVGFGTATITAMSPPSRGSTTTTATVEVFTSTSAAFDKPTLNAALAQTITATMHFDPPPSAPIQLFLSQTNPSIATMPDSFTIGTNGIGTFAVSAVGSGVTVISTSIPAFYGGGMPGFRFEVARPSNLTLSRIDTTSGPASGGQVVRIYGEAMTGRCTALFDGVSGLSTTAVVTAGYLTTIAPPHDPGTVAVMVRCGDETSTLPAAYTYTAALLRLLRMSPAIGAVTGGTVVSAIGENFRRGRCSLSFGGVAATTVQNDSSTEMLVSTPAHAAGSTDVTIRCGNDVATISNAFVFTGNDPQTQLAGSDPASGAPGERIAVDGSGFRDSDAIFFDATAGLDITTTSAAHFVTVPDLPPGNATITLHDVSGRIVPGPLFHVLATAAPQITSAPSRVAPSSEFLVNGAGFRRSLTFLLGGTALQQVEVGSTYARLRLPASITAGSYPLTIAGGTSARTIEVAPGLAVISVSIPCSSTEGGTLVTITGNGFAAGAVVAFGDADSSDVSVRDEHTILARVPPSAGIMNATITVTNRNGDSAELSNAFRYRWPDPGCAVPRHRGAIH